MDELRDAGFSLRALKKAGYEWHSFYLWCGLGCAELRALGFLQGSELRRFFEDHPEEALAPGEDGEPVVALTELLESGVSPNELRSLGGCSLVAMRGAGLSASTLRYECNFKPADFFKSGFTAEQLIASGFTHAELSMAGLQPPKKKEKKGAKKKDKGVTKLLPGILG